MTLTPLLKSSTGCGIGAIAGFFDDVVLYGGGRCAKVRQSDFNVPMEKGRRVLQGFVHAVSADMVRGCSLASMHGTLTRLCVMTMPVLLPWLGSSGRALNPHALHAPELLVPPTRVIACLVVCRALLPLAPDADGNVHAFLREKPADKVDPMQEAAQQLEAAILGLMREPLTWRGPQV